MKYLLIMSLLFLNNTTVYAANMTQKLMEKIVVDNAENIFEQIDLDTLLKDPRKYLNNLVGVFVEDHLDEIKLAEKEGIKLGKAILKAETNN